MKPSVDNKEPGAPPLRPIYELNDVKTAEWSDAELRHHQRVMSDLSPWLNAQGSAMLAQIVTEIEQRS